MRVQAPRELGLLAGEKCAQDADRCRRRRVVVELAHELMRREAFSREPVRTPERLRIRGEHLRHAALRARLLEAHSPRRQRRLEANRRGEIRRDGDDNGARGDLRVPGVHLHAAVRPADRPHGRIEHHALAELLRHAQRNQLRAADDAVCEALLRREQLVRPAGARDHPQTLEERERVRGLRQEAVGEIRAEVLSRGLDRRPRCAATRRT